MIIGKVVHTRASSPADAFAQARRIALEQGQRDAESSDPVAAARGRALAKIMPPFFDWLETEMAASKPQAATLALASVMAAMLANVCGSTTEVDDRVPWLERVCTLMATLANEQMSGRAHKIMIDGADKP